MSDITNLAQRVINGEQASLQPSKSIQVAQVRQTSYFFGLYIISQEQLSLDIDEVTRIQADKSYTIFVRVSNSADKATSLEPILISTDIQLRLTADHGCILIVNKGLSLKSEEIGRNDLEFKIKVDRYYLGDPVRLELQYRQVDIPARWQAVAELKFSSDDQSSPEDVFGPRSITLNECMEDQVRILHIANADADHYLIASFWGDQREFQCKIVKPALRLAEYIENNELPDSIIGYIREHSSTLSEYFEKWLINNLHKYGRNFCLIIHDNSEDSDMAWELIHIDLSQETDLFDNIANAENSLPPELCGEVPLGAVIVMTRWIPGLRWHRQYQILHVQEEKKFGKIVGYLDHTNLPHSRTELQSLQQFSFEAYPTMRKLAERLQSSLENIALIYLGCHGILAGGDLRKEFIIDHLRQPQEQIRVHQLELLTHLGDNRHRPIVIVNACYSGWHRTSGEARYGLPIVFLKRIAKDFIGTIGPIGDEEAADSAMNILNRIHSTVGGQRLAEILRDLRREAFLQTPKSFDDHKRWYKYLFTFMYVYYGNPFTQLQLELAGGPGREEQA